MSRRIFLLLALALFCTPLVAHIYLGSYGRFIADDFCSSAVARSQGIVRGALHWYLNWNGRYAANLLDSVFGYLGPGVTPYGTGLVVIVWFAVLAVTIQQMVPADGKGPGRFLLSCTIAAIVLFAVLEVIPLVDQSLYWGQGMRSVVPPLILGTAYVGLVWNRSMAGTVNRRGMWLLIAALLTFIAAGFAETYFAVQTSALVIALIAGVTLHRHGSTSSRSHILLVVAGLAGSLAGGLLMFVAPGNDFRRSPFPPSPPVPELLAIAFRGLREFFQVVVLAPGRGIVWAGIFVCAFVVGLGIFGRQEKSSHAYRGLIWTLVVLPAASFILLLACWVPMAWGTSLTLAPRTFIVPAYVLVSLVACWSYLAGRVCRQRIASHTILATALLLLVLVAFGLIAVNSSRKVWERRSAFAQYARDWDEREATIHRARSDGMRYAVVRRLQNSAQLDEIEVDPKITWLTKCLDEYYGINVVPDLGDLQGEPNGEAKQAALLDEFNGIRILPGSVPTELNRIYKSERGKIGFFKTDLSPEQIKSYYDRELARLGWKYIGTKPVEAFQRYSGGTQNLFCKGETAATLFITAQDEARLGYSYSLALNWGMSSGYVWGVVDCSN